MTHLFHWCQEKTLPEKMPSGNNPPPPPPPKKKKRKKKKNPQIIASMKKYPRKKSPRNIAPAKKAQQLNQNFFISGFIYTINL